jgi:ATP/maltotriose-dependent transcriptional regulator MalT/DNA-binding SARP family transcriptional activator
VTRPDFSQSQQVLERSRLLRRLKESLQRGHVLITAPAGYGKTILLLNLTLHHPQSFYIPLQIANLDLPVFMESLKGIDLARATLLLDDLQNISDSPAFLHWLAAALQKAYPRLVLTGRHLPDALISTLLASNRVSQFTENELAFSESETLAFLGSQYPGDPHRIAAWHHQLSGWPLGLALLAHFPGAIDPLVPTRSHLFEHLAGSVFQGLPPKLRRFLYVSAIPLRINEHLAIALWQGTEAEALALFHEIQSLNLFLQPSGSAGWFQYHDLVRDYLLSTSSDDLVKIHHKVIAWFDESGDLEMAIEHSLQSGFYQEATSLLNRLPDQFIRDQGRYLTFRRWVLALGQDALKNNPQLLLRLGNHLHRVDGFEGEAWTCLENALQIAEEQSDVATALSAHVELGRLHYREGAYQQALEHLNQVLAHPQTTAELRFKALQFAAHALGEQARFAEAQPLYEEAIELAGQLGFQEMQMVQRGNLALIVLVPLGKFQAARRQLQEVLAFFSASPGRKAGFLLLWCELMVAQGDWSGLATALKEMDEIMTTLEAPESSNTLWIWYYRACYACSQGRYAQIPAALAEIRRLGDDYPLALACAAWVETWMLRGQGNFIEAVKHAETSLAWPYDVEFYRALLALEADIASGLAYLAGQLDHFELHSPTRRLIAWRARAELVRLRALLCLVCHRQGNPGWRRHFKAVITAHRRPGYAMLLIQRDRQLGAAFWTLALRDPNAYSQAMQALIHLGEVEALIGLLQDPETEVVTRAAQVLAQIGREESLPAIASAFQATRNPIARQSLHQALDQLESLPPPTLSVQLMGEFRLWRGEQPIPRQSWPRPVVTRLFQYFALHHSQLLPRDRILEDLWGETSPQSAAQTFRSVYSRLRRFLDPFLRTNSPARYFQVEGEVYTFDPEKRYVLVDVETYTALVSTALKNAEEDEVSQFPEQLLRVLENTQPLLPELPYEEWLLAPRERLQTLHVEGCLYVAQAMLEMNKASEALRWAERALQQAPWLEEGYQARMRAHARLGQRSQALKTFDEATVVLKRELGVEPSQLTRWLAERLQRGDPI